MLLFPAQIKVERGVPFFLPYLTASFLVGFDFISKVRNLQRRSTDKVAISQKYGTS